MEAERADKKQTSFHSHTTSIHSHTTSSHSHTTSIHSHTTSSHGHTKSHALVPSYTMSQVHHLIVTQWYIHHYLVTHASFHSLVASEMARSWYNLARENLGSFISFNN